MRRDRATSRRPAALSVGCLLAITGLLAGSGCGAGDDRVEHHLDRARALLADDRGQEAIVELRAAAQIRLDDPELSARVAEVAAAHGRPDLATEYYEDAYALDPENDETALALARLSIAEDPERAQELVDQVIAHSPGSVPAHLVLAELRLAQGRVPEARTLVDRARRLDPDDPEVYWVLAHVHEARVRGIRARAAGAVAGRASLDSILDAYAAYVEQGGERRVQAALGRARAIGSWTGLHDEARAAWQEAIDLAVAEGSPAEQMQVMRAASHYAEALGETGLERTALERWLEVTPQALGVWERLAALPGPDGGDQSEAVYARMLEAHPENPGAHVVYANHLAASRGYASALEYLEERVGTGMDDGVLLGGLVQLQHAHRRPLDAARTLERLQADYGDRPATALLLARHQLGEHRLDAAAATLRDSLARHDSAEGRRLLAQVELMRKRPDEALAEVERAIALSGRSTPDGLRLKARIQMARGDSRQAAASLARLQRIEPLTTEDRVMLARAYYDSHAVIHGRQILENMLAGRNPSPEAALELGRRELDVPQRRPVVRKWLERVHRRYPGHVGVIDLLTEDDLAQGRPKDALARVTRAILHRPKHGELYLSRARLLIEIGRPADAALDAQRAAAVAPAVRDEAYELLASIYLGARDTAEIIDMLEQRDDAGKASPDEIALLARLSLHTGDVEKARALYERALEDGSDLTLLKNDLAYLLADSGEDLDRALRLAREAANAEGEQLAAADTLGYVYLKSGQYEAAFWQFRQVVEEASPPVAEYYYHLALALMKMERHADARDALAEALRIQPDYPPARSAMQELEAMAGPEERRTTPS